jgi:copper chaperone NosL
MKSNSKISTVTKYSLLICGVLLAISIAVPLWRIDLDAPQYPEGLGLLIYTYKLGGDVEIINGLNHYIGMQTLHAENFIEFTILPYIIGFYALLAIIAAIVAKKRGLYFWFAAFVLFGIVSMIDFWRWEYNYGHNLDPNAAIIVPGMAYQPPLIGFKQLLNFGAYSIPSIGGWLFIVTGLLALAAVVYEVKYRKNA